MEELPLINNPVDAKQLENWERLQQRRLNENIDNQKEFLLTIIDDEIIGHVIVDCNKQAPHTQALLMKEELETKVIDQ